MSKLIVLRPVDLIGPATPGEGGIALSIVLNKVVRQIAIKDSLVDRGKFRNIYLASVLRLELR
jgi:hypothetical protein